ncbi:MAG TPA: response regulator [Methylomirabilota bacterium]|nr:response regulator [Methylomirabilota bacterium]
MSPLSGDPPQAPTEFRSSSTTSALPTVLVVDDEPSVLASLESTLTRAGYRVRTAESVSEASEAVRRRIPDVIIADLWLQADDGQSLWDALSSRGGVRPDRFVLLTGTGSDEAVIRRAERTGLCVIAKPCEPEHLLRIVREIVSRPKPRILVVDDDKRILEVFRELLSWYGYEAVLASSGVEALALIKTTHVDAIAIDLHLPHMPGTVLWERIRKEAPDLASRAVFVTATPEKLERDHRLPCPVVAKPFDHEHLVQVLGGLIIPLTWK